MCYCRSEDRENLQKLFRSGHPSIKYTKPKRQGLYEDMGKALGFMLFFIGLGMVIGLAGVSRPYRASDRRSSVSAVRLSSIL